MKRALAAVAMVAACGFWPAKNELFAQNCRGFNTSNLQRQLNQQRLSQLNLQRQLNNLQRQQGFSSQNFNGFNLQPQPIIIRQRGNSGFGGFGNRRGGLGSFLIRRTLGSLISRGIRGRRR